MEKVIGLELVKETKEVFEDAQHIFKFITKYRLDYYQFGIVVKNEKDHLETKKMLEENEVFEGSFPLYMLYYLEPKNTFSDFGFISYENKPFLYAELVIPFSISGNNEKDVKAALEQMDEHLVAIDFRSNKTYYFVERYHQELIQGIADAYKIIVTFYP